MKSATAAAVALTLATVAYAQNTTATSSAAAGIPTNISATCNTYLNGLNSDVDISSCLNKLVDATSDFNPSSNSGASASSVTTVLNSICDSHFTSCDATTIRGKLSAFYVACQSDMLGSSGNGSDGNRAVIDIYDVLYVLTPLKEAICTKDGSEYCINKIASGTTADTPTSSTPGATDNSGAQSAPGSSDTNSGTASGSGSASGSAPATTSSASGSGSASGTASSSSSAASASATHAKRDGVAARPFYRRADNTTDQETLGGVAPNATEYNNAGLPYLFITPNMTQAELCTTCTSKVVGSYISWEQLTPYALGISNSPMLSGQITLWNQIKTCPGNYASQLLNNATASSGVAPADSTDGALAGARLGAAQVVGAALVALVGGMMLF